MDTVRVNYSIYIFLNFKETTSTNSKAQETQLTEIANQKKIFEAIKSRKKI